MKNFQSIPKSQIFTREQLKAIRGGDDGYYGILQDQVAQKMPTDFAELIVRRKLELQQNAAGVLVRVAGKF